MTVSLRAPSSLTMASINSFASQVRDGVAGGNLLFDLSDLAESDLSFLQLIEGARRDARAAGGAIRLSAPAGAPLAALLERAGLTAAMGSEDIDFWFHGELPR